MTEEPRSDGAPAPATGGTGDRLPHDPDSGEPLLARWFVVAMVVLVPAGLVVILVAFLAVSGGDGTVDPAARRPPGSTEVTHFRGEAALPEDPTTAPAEGCARGVRVVGEVGARATAGRALQGLCEVLDRGEFPVAERGLGRWKGQDGLLRVVAFELTGVESSARLDGGRLLVELNPKFQLADAVQAAPTLVHELVHLGDGMPGRRVDAPAELAALRAQARACELLGFDADPPRGCRDAAQTLETDDPLARLVEAGYPR